MRCLVWRTLEHSISTHSGEKDSSSPLHRCFIGACFTGRQVKEHAHNSSLRLLVEGSVLGLVLGAWLWGGLTLGANQAKVAQSPHPSDGAHLSEYVVACPGLQSPEEGGGSLGGDGGASGCLGEVRSHTSTTRQPGAGLTEQQGHRGDT